MASKVAFLDRDGTINVDHGYVHKKEDWEFTAGAVEALQQLQAGGFKLAIVTNQSGIAHGLYGEDDMHALHEHLQEIIKHSGITLAAITFCPHARDGSCECRKPKPGLAKQVEAAIGPIDYASSWMIGDKLADMEFGKNIGTHTALVRSSYWQEADLKMQPDHIVDSLRAAAQIICNTTGESKK